MKIILKENDKKLDRVFKPLKNTRSVAKIKPSAQCYTKAEIKRAVRIYAKEVFDETGELPTELSISNKPTYRPWRVFNFKLLKSGAYSFAGLNYYTKSPKIQGYVLVRKGDNPYENTYSNFLSSLQIDLNSHLLVDFIRKERLPIKYIYDMDGGYHIGRCNICICSGGEITLFDTNKKVTELEVIDYLKCIKKNV
ncbi:hypothetical protein [Maribacter aquivivus]|uniref:hypothetical protein n=1 Tax=Maribacter aquivivus TaxID=228958 RepID=UPI0024940E6D|nr:hypothetical protein [Maribacter aquivivus]